VANNCLNAIEGLMRGICNQSAKKAEMRVIPQEVDYDKLAESIVHAIKQSKEEELEKTKKDSSARVLAAISSGMFFFLGAAFLAVTVIVFLGAYRLFPDLEWNSVNHFILSVIEIVAMILIFIASLGMMVFSFMAMSEVSLEKDRNYVVAVTSTLTSLVALIVALVALVK